MSNSQKLARSGVPVYSTLSGAADPLGYHQFAGSGALIAWTPPEGTSFAVMVASASGWRFRDDGVNPSATVGFPISEVAGQPTVYCADIAALKIWGQTGTLDVLYYGKAP